MYFLKGAITMATKSANLYVRIEPEVKEQAEQSRLVKHLQTFARITNYDV